MTITARAFTPTHTLNTAIPVAMGSDGEQSFCDDGEALVRNAHGDPIICQWRELEPAPALTPTPAPAARGYDALVGDAAAVNRSTLTGGNFRPCGEKTMAALERAYAYTTAVRHGSAPLRCDPRSPVVDMTTAQVYALKRQGLVTIVDWTLRDRQGRRRPCWIEITARGENACVGRRRAAEASARPIVTVTW